MYDWQSALDRTLRRGLRAGAASFAAALVAACGESRDPQTLAVGAKVYAAHCASCHGANLEGQPNWKEKLSDGKVPAPPHDDSGHTWRHTDRWLFQVVEAGMVPPFAKSGHGSDMPGFRGKLSDDEIQAVLAYIKSRWSEGTHRKRQQYLRTRRAEALSPGHVLEKHLRSK